MRRARPRSRFKLPSLVRLLAHVLVLGLLAQVSGFAHLLGDVLFPHGVEVSSSCPDEEEGGDCPPGCPACHACDHRQAVPTTPSIPLVPRGPLARLETEPARFESPPSPPRTGIYRPPKATNV